MRILVLGGAGYIGSHMVYELIANNIETVVVDNLETGHREAVHPAAAFYEGDIRNREFIDSVFDREKIDGVIHFAANSLVVESMHNPLKYFDNNVCGTKVLLESMIAHNVKKIVFSSSAATYGEPDEIPIKETAKTSPINTYGETKLTMEKMMKWCDQAYGLRYVALRYFNACGAHESGAIGEAHNTETHLIPLILQVPLGQRENIKICGQDYNTKDGTNIRDYVHVNDLAKAHILAMNYLMEGNQSDVFNLGSSEGFSVLEIIEAARRAAGLTIPAVPAERRPGDPAVLIASSEKARTILGWERKYTDIEEIIKTAWKWHSSHPHGYER